MKINCEIMVYIQFEKTSGKKLKTHLNILNSFEKCQN